MSCRCAILLSLLGSVMSYNFDYDLAHELAGYAMASYCGP